MGVPHGYGRHAYQSSAGLTCKQWVNKSSQLLYFSAKLHLKFPDNITKQVVFCCTPEIPRIATSCILECFSDVQICRNSNLVEFSGFLISPFSWISNFVEFQCSSTPLVLVMLLNLASALHNQVPHFLKKICRLSRLPVFAHSTRVTHNTVHSFRDVNRYLRWSCGSTYSQELP